MISHSVLISNFDLYNGNLKQIPNTGATALKTTRSYVLVYCIVSSDFRQVHTLQQYSYYAWSTCDLIGSWSGPGLSIEPLFQGTQNRIESHSFSAWNFRLFPNYTYFNGDWITLFASKNIMKKQPCRFQNRTFK